MRKKLVAITLAILLGGLLQAWPAYAWRCPSLVAEARGLFAKVKDVGAKKRLTKLIDAGEKDHNAGGHDEAVAKLEEALKELHR